MNYKFLIISLFILLPIYFCTGNSVEQEKDLYKAVLKEDGQKVKDLLNSDNVNMQNEGGMTLLHQASRLGNLEIAQMLVDKGANVNARTAFNFIPLHFATMYGHPKIVKLLLDKGSEVKVKNNYLVTPIFYITRHPQAAAKEMLELLIKHGADVNSEDQFGRTLLISALQRPDYDDVVEVLIKNGVNVNKRGGLTRQAPIYLACLKRNKKAVKLLLDHGADPNVQSSYGRFIQTPLTISILFDKLEITKLLVEKGAEINVLQIRKYDYDDKHYNHHSPLHRAIANDNLEMVQFLVEKGAHIQYYEKKKVFYLHVPEKYRNSTNNFIEKDRDFNTYLNWFTKIKDRYAFRINEPYEYSAHNFPLLHAVLLKKYKIVQFILEKGADPNANNGEPLREAIKLEDIKLVQILINKGAKTNYKDSNGKSIMDLAIEKKNHQIIKILKKI